MRTHPIPFNEEARVAAVQHVPGLTRENEALFDALCDATAKLFGCPIAHISVVEQDTQWYKSVVGIELGEMPKNQSFCTHTIMTEQPMIIPDLSKDPKFADHPMVAEGGPQARFYAGVPLILSSGYRFGSLCALDLVPHDAPSERDMAVLKDMGRAIVAALEKAPAEPAAVPSDQGQSAFLTLVGHELRTPLTIVHGAMRILESRLDDQVSKKLANSSIKSSEHLSTLIDSILKFSNINTGELQLNEQSTNMAELLDDVQQNHQFSVAEVGKTITTPTSDMHGEILVDQEHIKICLTSLMLNSVLHGGDEIAISCGHDPAGNVEICVSDNGSIDDHVELAELYKPFIVGGDVEKRGTGGGLGLGLPLTRKLVELHGGEFEVRAEPTQTVAIIRLPKWRTVN
ncbi:GAF domain-containing sensor histidine kinase [Sulfitobacter mediterraneus]|uniref:GAF domain-containing sensor histidine kinase n=1 Tax=Sulfitobacter mediterraneus TaxID=83219 RepID=UPI000EA0B82A|nr:GAF domain-containing sensor histidine kinase [Sulfitobacter mediterraneus]